MVDPTALFHNHTFLLFFFICFFKELTNLLVSLVTLVFLGIGWMINYIKLLDNFFLELSHVFSHLVEVLDSQLHYSVEAPINISKSMPLIKNKCNYRVFTLSYIIQILVARCMYIQYWLSTPLDFLEVSIN